MKKCLFFLVAAALLACPTAVLADGGQPVVPSPAPATISSSMGSAATAGIRPFGFVCQVDSISYRLLTGTRSFVEFSPKSHCTDGAAPAGYWLYGGTAPYKWEVDGRKTNVVVNGFSRLQMLKVPATSIGRHFHVSFGLAGVGARCGFNLNIKFGFTGTVRCH